MLAESIPVESIPGLFNRLKIPSGSCIICSAVLAEF